MFGCSCSQEELAHLYDYEVLTMFSKLRFFASTPKRPSRLRRFISRNRTLVLGLVSLALIMVVLTYLAYTCDIFLTADEVSRAKETVDLDESLLLSATLVVGLLIISLERYMALRSEVRRRVAAERYARELAYQDPLTGLANRREFEEALDEAAAKPPSAGGVHALLIVDLNRFKQINDIYGHAIGDEVLIIVAQRLLKAVRSGDLVSRLGGDEFTILARHLLGPEAATNIARRVVSELSEPIHTGTLWHSISAAVGIALLPTDATSGGESFRKADVALYRAKAERRFAFRFFEEGMDLLVRERAQLEQELRTAIRLGQIEPWFWPSYDLKSGDVVGLEAVPRWITPRNAFCRWPKKAA